MRVREGIIEEEFCDCFLFYQEIVRTAGTELAAEPAAIAATAAIKSPAAEPAAGGTAAAVWHLCITKKIIFG